MTLKGSTYFNSHTPLARLLEGQIMAHKKLNDSFTAFRVYYSYLKHRHRQASNDDPRMTAA